MLIKAESLLFLLPLLTLVVAPMSQRRVTDEMKPLSPLPRGSPPCASSRPAPERTRLLELPAESMEEAGTGAGGGWGEGGVGSADWSHPSREGLAAAANSHLVRRLRLARPGPRGGLLLLLHGCHRRRPALPLTSSRALQTRGPSLGSDRMSQEPDALRTGRRESGSDGVGGGERQGGEEERHQAGSPLQDPSFGYRRPSNSPLPPPPTTPKRREPRRSNTTKWQVSGAARHLTALERRLTAPEEPG